MHVLYLVIAAGDAMQAQTPLYIAINGAIAAVIGVADPIKPGAREAIAALHKSGLRVMMLTGDHRVTADVVARELGIDAVRAEVLPADKANEVAKLQAAGEVVGMVGDGINDAPALARADVGFAIGSGTDVAMESADVTLIGGSLLGVLDAIRISRATVRNIRQNLFGAFIYNIVGIPVAAGVLYPFTGFQLNPMLAGLAMALSSVSVVSDAPEFLKTRGIHTSFSPTELKNYLVQGGATGDKVPLMVRHIFRVLRNVPELRGKVFLINTVHDSILFDVHESVVSQVIALVRHHLSSMREVFEENINCKGELPLPYNVEVRVGDNWLDVKPT